MKSKKLISSLLALALSVGSFAALTVVSAEENAQAPTWSIVSASEDFADDKYDDIFKTDKNLGTSTLGNGVMNLKANNVSNGFGEFPRVKIVPNKAMQAAIAADGTGKLVYQFDVKYATDAANSNFQVRIANPDTGMILNLIDSKGVYQDGKWHTVKYEFDLKGTKKVVDEATITEKYVDIYVDDAKIATTEYANIEETTKVKRHDPINGITFRGWVPDGFNADIDNVKAGYITGEPTLVSAITVGGVTPVNDEVTLSNKAYAGLSEADVVVTAAEGTDVTKTVETVDGVKTVKVTASQWPATETYTITCAKTYPNNEWATEDFQGETYNSAFVKSGYAVVDTYPENSSNKVLKISNTSGKNVDLETSIVPSAAMKLPETKTGKLVYEYEMLFSSEGNHYNPGNPDDLTNVGHRIKDRNGMTVAIVRPSNIFVSAWDEPLKQAFNKDDYYKWRTMRFEFDYATETFDAYVEGRQFADGVSFKDVPSGKTYYDPSEGLCAIAYCQPTFTYYIDDVKVSYIETQEEIISSIRVAGEEVVDGTVAVPNEKFLNLSEADVEVTMAAGYENAEIKVEVADGTLTVTATEFPYTSTKAITYTKKVAGLYVEENNDLLIADKEWGTVTNESDPKDAANTVKKVTSKNPYNGVSTNIQAYIVPSEAFKATLPKDKTGQLVYQFDMLKSDVSGTVNIFSKGQKSINGWEIATGSECAEWTTIKVVFDYTSEIVTVYHGTNPKNDCGIKYPEDPTLGIKLHSWAAPAYNYYIKNINVSYVESIPQLVSEFKIADVPVDVSKTYQTLKLTQAQYDAVTDYKTIAYTLADGVRVVNENRGVITNKTTGAKAVRFILDCGKYDKVVYTVDLAVKAENKITSFTATKSATGIDASATYTLAELSETDNPYVIIAVYEDNRLIGTELFDADADEDKTVTFNLTYNLNAEKTYTAKAMLWDMTTLLPLVGAQELTVQ